MKFYTSSRKLAKNAGAFYDFKIYNFLSSFFEKPGKSDVFVGWGRKKSGQKAEILSKKFGAKTLFLEDGFIRSFKLSSQSARPLSVVWDDVGIYYDATCPSRLENLLNFAEFNEELLGKAKKAIALIKEFEISKYNAHEPLPVDFLKAGEKRVLIITQVLGDLSLKYCLSKISTKEMINVARSENKDAKIYIKIHPDVLCGRKKADFDMRDLPKNCKIISKNYNPIALLKHFDKVYTKSSQMGFEALICGAECVCFGLPFYAGWGLCDERVKCARRLKKRSLEELFAAAYLLYPRYFSPRKNCECDIFEVLFYLKDLKDKFLDSAF